MPETNGRPFGINGRIGNLKGHRGPRFGKEKPAIPGPGRPQIPPQIKQDRNDAKRILNENSAKAATRLSELVESLDPEIAIRASDCILKRTVPEVGEVDIHDTRPLQQLPDDVVAQLLARAASAPATNGHSGNGAPTE